MESIKKVGGKMILFLIFISSCSTSNLRVKHKVLEKGFIEKAIVDDYSFLDGVTKEDLDRLTDEEEEYEDECWDGPHNITLLNIIARWDNQEIVSKFLDTVTKACEEDLIEKRKEVAVKCLEKAFLHKSINFIKGSFNLIDAKDVSKEDAARLLDLCLDTEDERNLKIYEECHDLEEDVYESLKLLLEVTSQNDYVNDILTDEIVEKIICLDYIDLDSELGTMDLVVKFKKAEELERNWIKNHRLTRLIKNERLIATAASLIEIYEKNERSSIQELFTHKDFQHLLKEMNMEWRRKDIEDLNEINNDEEGKLLYQAAQSGDYQKCLSIIKKGADIEFYENSLGITPLWIAAQNGHTKICKLLLENGANIEATNIKGLTPLFIAVENHKVDICVLLIERGANINYKMMDGTTILWIIACQGYTDLAKLLLDKGVYSDYAEHTYGSTPLWIAAQNGYTEICEMLIKNGVNIESTDIRGATPLLIAAANNQITVCKLLLDSGANIQATDKNNITPIWIASQNGHLEVCKLLLERGAEVNAASKSESTALMLAAENGHDRVCDLLIRRGAKVDLADNNGKTALISAAKNGHKEVCELLIERVAKLDAARENGWKALMLAAENGHDRVCDLLCDSLIGRGAKIDLADEDKDVKMALMLAAHEGQKEVCDLLIRRKARRSLTDKDGKTVKNTNKKTALSYQCTTAFLNPELPSHVSGVREIHSTGGLAEVSKEKDATVEKRE